MRNVVDSSDTRQVLSIADIRGWAFYVERDGVQTPVYRYNPLTTVTSSDREFSSATKRVVSRLVRETERRRSPVIYGPSVAELAKSSGITPRTWRHHRDQLVERGLLTKEHAYGAPRHPDTYVLDLAHPLLSGEIIHLPDALTHLPAQVELLVGLIAWRNGSYGPRPISIAEIASALGLTARAADDAVRACVDRFGVLRRLPTRGCATSYALVGDWWRVPRALREREGLAPVPVVRRGGPTQFLTATHAVLDRTHAVLDRTHAENRAPTDPLVTPSLIPPSGTPSHTHRRAGCAGTSDGLGLATSPTGRGLRPRAYEMPPDSAAEDRTEGEGTTPRERGEGATRPLDAPPVPPAPPAGVEDLSAALHRMEERWAAVCDQMDQGVRHGWDADDRAQVEHRVREVAADVGDLGAALARVEAALDLHLRTWRDRCAHHYWLSRCPTDPYPAIEVFVGKMFGELLRELDGAPMSRRKARRVSRKREVLDRDEFDPEAAKDQPKIGWGEPGSRRRQERDSRFPKVGWGPVQ